MVTSLSRPLPSSPNTRIITKIEKLELVCAQLQSDLVTITAQRDQAWNELQKLRLLQRGVPVSIRTPTGEEDLGEYHARISSAVIAEDDFDDYFGDDNEEGDDYGEGSWSETCEKVAPEDGGDRQKSIHNSTHHVCEFHGSTLDDVLKEDEITPALPSTQAADTTQAVDKFDHYHQGQQSFPEPCNRKVSIMNGTWLIESTVPKGIADAESAIAQDHHQKALAILDLYISHSKLLCSRINATLLKSCVLRACDDAVRGLEFAETALYLADRNELYALVCKAQLYRGMSLLDLGYPAEASWCFTRAANREWFAHDVGHWKEVAEKERKGLRRSDPRRRLSPDFLTVPVPVNLVSFDP